MASVYAGPVRCGHCDGALPAAPEAFCFCGKRQADFRILRFRPFRQGALLSGIPVAAGAPCAYHAGNQAVAPCGRCGSFLCDLCRTEVERKVYCPACFERLHAQGAFATLKNAYPRPHATALLLSFISWIPFAGLLALPFAVWQFVKAIRIRAQLAEREARVILYLVVTVLFCLLGLLGSLGMLFGLVLK